MNQSLSLMKGAMPLNLTHIKETSSKESSKGILGGENVQSQEDRKF